jgi:phosphatidyl-myo-inositol alpha-mannosyltransferase
MGEHCRPGGHGVKIAIVSPYDWSFPGGVRSHIEHLTAELRRRGHSVRIITSASGPQGRNVEYGVYKLGWATPLRINGSVARVSLSPTMTGVLRRLLERERFDVVHVHEPFVSMLTLGVVRLAHEMGTTCIATFHASTNRRTSAVGMAYAMAAPFLQSSFERLDGMIAVSEAAREHVGRVFSGNYTIIPNGIDVQHFAGDAPRVPAFDDGKRNILFLGRMEPRKGLRYLLKAIPLVRESLAGANVPPVRFILAGDGPQSVQFQRFVQKKGWEDVVFTGYIPDAEKASYFATADIYCAPSTGNESQGIVLLEAMASGTPVVASNIPGYRTVITSPEMGVLTPPNDPERLAWALCHLLRDDQVRQSIAAQGRARAQAYSWERVTTEIERVYSEGQASTPRPIFPSATIDLSIAPLSAGDASPL